MTRECRNLGRYRDGELAAAERERFRIHLAACAECRRAIALLENLRRVLARGEPPLEERIPAIPAARRAATWEHLVTAWLRPAQAWIALAVISTVFAILGLERSAASADPQAAYELLLQYSAPEPAGALEIRSDEDLLGWLQEEAK